jgi:hypothetical protein
MTRNRYLDWFRQSENDWKIAQELGIIGEMEEIGKYLELFYIPTWHPDSLPEKLTLNLLTNNKRKRL